MKASFIFLSCNTPWVNSLAREVAKYSPVIAIGNGIKRGGGFGPEIPELRKSTNNFQWHEWVMPPGYVGAFSWFFSPILARKVLHHAKLTKKKTGIKPYLVVPYPYNFPWLSCVNDYPIIYYNLDDYRLYEQKKESLVVCQEDKLLDLAKAVICLSRTQTIRLRGRTNHPDRVQHLPLGVIDQFIQEDPNYPVQAGSVVYIGNMENRVDWDYVARVVTSCPSLDFYFAGIIRESSNSPEKWEIKRKEVLSYSNVHAIGEIAQSEITDWSWKAAVNWMPYDVTHPFNIASCPTKIMDYLASGRPVLSTSVPECQLHPERITIHDSPTAAAIWLNQHATNPPNYNAQSVTYAQENNWQNRARSFIEICENNSTHES